MKLIQQIKTGYNQVALAYAQDRTSLKSHHYLQQLQQLLKPQSQILDIGCGNGQPVAEFLLKAGHLVTGLDISEVQIALARKNCPRGHFLIKDMAELQKGEYSVDAVVCFYALFHLPRSRHLEMLKIWQSFLTEGGLLLVTMGDKDFEGYHDFYGVKMWSSHFGPSKNIQLLSAAGFKILFETIDTSGREKHQIILAQKQQRMA